MAIASWMVLLLVVGIQSCNPFPSIPFGGSGTDEPYRVPVTDACSAGISPLDLPSETGEVDKVLELLAPGSA